MKLSKEELDTALKAFNSALDGLCEQCLRRKASSSDWDRYKRLQGSSDVCFEPQGNCVRGHKAGVDTKIRLTAAFSAVQTVAPETVGEESWSITGVPDTVIDPKLLGARD